MSIFSENIEKLSNLSTLQLNNCDIDDECFLLLIEGIKKSKCLKHLELNNNNLTEYSADYVKVFFDENESLESLYLLNNQLCKRDMNKKLKDSDLTKIVSEY